MIWRQSRCVYVQLNFFNEKIKLKFERLSHVCRLCLALTTSNDVFYLVQARACTPMNTLQQPEVDDSENIHTFRVGTPQTFSYTVCPCLLASPNWPIFWGALLHLSLSRSLSTFVLLFPQMKKYKILYEKRQKTIGKRQTGSSPVFPSLRWLPLPSGTLLTQCSIRL